MSIKAVYNPFRRKEKSWDAALKVEKDTVTKRYIENAAHIQWINKELKEYYDPDEGLPVVQHEWAALSLLHDNGIAPKPLDKGRDYLVMERFGRDMTRYTILDRGFFQDEAKRLWEIMQSVGFVHNDVLKRNILYDGKTLKLIDFTLAEFNGIRFVHNIPDQSWMKPGDERLLEMFY